MIKTFANEIKKYPSLILGIAITIFLLGIFAWIFKPGESEFGTQSGRARYHGGLIYNLTIDSTKLINHIIDSTKLVNRTIDSTKQVTDLSAVLKANTVGGVQVYEPTLGYLWIPVDWDSGGAIATTVQGSGGWSFGGDNAPTAEYKPASGEPFFKVFGFDADGIITTTDNGDDTVWVSFPAPDNYKDDTMELYLYWFHLDNNGGVSDTITWGGNVLAICATDTTADLWDTGTRMDSVVTITQYSGPGSDATSDSLLFVTNLDPEVTNIDSGDDIKILLYLDEDRSSLDSSECVYLYKLKVTWDILDVP